MTNGDDAVTAAFGRLASWMFDMALPFWSTTGRDPQGYGFVEHLTLAAVPAPVAYKRVRVQARQVYVFSHAALLGFDGGAAAAANGYDFLTKHACLGGGRWASRLGREGGVVDATADLYDLAFVLFAFAWYARLTRSAEAIDRAYATLQWIRGHMRGPNGGFLNTLPGGSGWRQQNPHMHLLEAVLALYGTTGDALFLEMAGELVALFRTAFFDAETGTLGEFFRDDWSRAEGEAGAHVEPGHHYEWVWLLDRYERFTGDTAGAAPGRLYAFANRYGQRAGTGLVVDVVDRAGAVRDASFRLWPQTEAIKAHLIMAERAGAGVDPVFSERVVTCIDNFLTVFVQDGGASVWMDHFSAEGLPKSDRIPSSSLYHVFTAFGELARLVRARV